MRKRFRHDSPGLPEGCARAHPTYWLVAAAPPGRLDEQSGAQQRRIAQILEGRKSRNASQLVYCNGYLMNILGPGHNNRTEASQSACDSDSDSDSHGDAARRPVEFRREGAQHGVASGDRNSVGRQQVCAPGGSQAHAHQAGRPATRRTVSNNARKGSRKDRRHWSVVAAVVSGGEPTLGRTAARKAMKRGEQFVCSFPDFGKHGRPARLVLILVAWNPAGRLAAAR